MNWEPKEHHDDPAVNAMLNIAESLSECASAIGGLLYGLKYSGEQGLSIAEAIEVSAKSVASALAEVAGKIDDVAGAMHSDGVNVAEHLDYISRKLENNDGEGVPEAIANAATIIAMGDR